jgi:hypothetical protein
MIFLITSSFGFLKILGIKEVCLVLIFSKFRCKGSLCGQLSIRTSNNQKIMKYGTQRRTKRMFMVPTSFGLQTNYKLQKNSLTIHCSQKTKSNHRTTNYKLQPHTIPWKPITYKKKGMHQNFILVYKELNHIPSFQ